MYPRTEKENLFYGIIVQMNNCTCVCTDVLILDVYQMKNTELPENSNIFLDQTRLFKISRENTEENQLLSIGAGYAALFLLHKRGLSQDALYFDNDGKPLIKGLNSWLSLSHSEQYVMAGISSMPIGVDIERINPDLFYLKDHCLTSEEKSYLKSFPPEFQLQKFFELFSMKECMIKRDGLKDLRDLSVFHPVDCGSFTAFTVNGYSCMCYSDQNIPVHLYKPSMDQFIKIVYNELVPSRQ